MDPHSPNKVIDLPTSPIECLVIKTQIVFATKSDWLNKGIIWNHDDAKAELSNYMIRLIENNRFECID